jgi:hypothetical protein|tara:strand:- start:6 stop:497 length:492 start_codon:yes stop_codon:yes gene_type:complete
MSHKAEKLKRQLLIGKLQPLFSIETMTKFLHDCQKEFNKIDEQYLDYVVSMNNICKKHFENWYMLHNDTDIDLDWFYKKPKHEQNIIYLEFYDTQFNTSKSKITNKQREAENYVNEYITRNNQPPTYLQVAEYLNLKSTNTAYHRLRHCRKKMNQSKTRNKQL